MATSGHAEDESPESQENQPIDSKKREECLEMDKKQSTKGSRHPDAAFIEWLEGVRRRRRKEQYYMTNALRSNSLYPFLPDREVNPCTPIQVRYYMRLWRPCANPLPELSWAERDDLWRNMVELDDRYNKDKHWLRRHPALSKRFRSLMIDWLMEISELHRLQRETFYLAQDYFDRFMTATQGVDEDNMQLIGITCLFMAAKLEEVTPPYLYQFAFLTDSYCSREAICKMERIILQALDWRLSTMTAISWLNFYMHTAYPGDSDSFLMPQSPWHIYTKVTALLDMCVLDIECLQFSNRVLAAATLYHFAGSQIVEQASGFNVTDLSRCIEWVIPFAITICDMSSTDPKLIRESYPDDRCNLQTRTGTLELLDIAGHYKAEYEARRSAASAHPVQPPNCNAHQEEVRPQAPLVRAMLQAPTVHSNYFRSLLDGMKSPSFGRARPEGQQHLQPPCYMPLLDVQPPPTQDDAPLEEEEDEEQEEEEEQPSTSSAWNYCLSSRLRHQRQHVVI